MKRFSRAQVARQADEARFNDGRPSVSLKQAARSSWPHRGNAGSDIDSRARRIAIVVEIRQAVCVGLVN